jgi:hypothetical protein
MDRKGAGYAHEILMGVFILVFVMMFYAKDSQAMMPPMFIVLGGIMILGGFVMREPMVIAGGFVVLAIALMYSEVFVK